MRILRWAMDPWIQPASWNRKTRAAASLLWSGDEFFSFSLSPFFFARRERLTDRLG
jgi:hypothetical protein